MSKSRQMQKATHCLVSLTGNVQKRQIHRESRPEVTRGGRRTGNDRYHLKLDVAKSAELLEMTVNQDGPESQLSLCVKYTSAQNPPKSNTKIPQNNQDVSSFHFTAKTEFEDPPKVTELGLLPQSESVAQESAYLSRHEVLDSIPSIPHTRTPYRYRYKKKMAKKIFGTREEWLKCLILH